MDKINAILSALRKSESTSWVAEQTTFTFSQGLSVSGKEASQELAFAALEPAGLTYRERRKREKYETTRPYSDGEKLDLLVRALTTFFIDLPAIQMAAFSGLRGLGVDAATVEFVTPDEPGQGEAAYSMSLQAVASQKEYLAHKFREFAEMLSS